MSSELAQVIIAVGMLITSISSLVAVVLTYLARRDVRKIEIATNSMKDALVKATGDAKFAEGREVGRQRLP